MKFSLVDLPGVYKIENLVNGKFYIGSTVSLCRRQRQHWHELRRGDHHAVRLQAAWNKYGEDAFVVKILELCEIEDLTEKEQGWLNILQPSDPKIGYNSCPWVGARNGGASSPEFSDWLSQKKQRDAASSSKRITKHPSSAFKGVHFDRVTKKYASEIRRGGKRYCLGRYDSEEGAAAQYDSASYYLDGESAFLNFPDAPIIPFDPTGGSKRMIATNKSGYRGVSWCSRTSKWMVSCGYKSDGQRKSRSGGRFIDSIEAAKAYDKLALELHGEQAMLNFRTEDAV